jgi:hypothetical protein
MREKPSVFFAGGFSFCERSEVLVAEDSSAFLILQMRGRKSRRYHCVK